MLMVLLSYLCMLVVGTNGNELDSLREAYFRATNANGVAQFKKISEARMKEGTVQQAYHGAALAMSAGYAEGIWTRMELFNSGKSLLEEAITQDATNPEIRFLRFSIQANIPSILMYSGNMDEDLNQICTSLTRLNKPTPFWKKAIQVMLDSEKTTTKQKVRLKALLEL